MRCLASHLAAPPPSPGRAVSTLRRFFGVFFFFLAGPRASEKVLTDVVPASRVLRGVAAAKFAGGESSAWSGGWRRRKSGRGKRRVRLAVVRARRVAEARRAQGAGRLLLGGCSSGWTGRAEPLPRDGRAWRAWRLGRAAAVFLLY